MRNVLLIKTLIGKTKFYEHLRSAWYRHLREIPRKRLRRFGPQAINVVYDALSAQGVDYWVDFGTAIGMVRDSGFIKHDDDIDFSLMAGTITPLNLYKTLSNCKQFSFSHAFEYQGQITEMTFLYKKIEVDFFFSYRYGDRMITPAYKPSGDGCSSHKHKWSAYGIDRCCVSTVDKITVHGMNVLIPRNYDEILTDCYGKWRVPVVGWTLKNDYGQKPRIPFEGLGLVVDANRVVEIGDTVDLTIFAQALETHNDTK